MKLNKMVIAKLTQMITINNFLKKIELYKI